MWGRFVNLTQIIHVTTTLDLSAPLHHFFSKGRITASKEVKTIISRGMWRVSVMRDWQSCPRQLEAVQRHFLIVFSLKPDQLFNKRSNSWHEQLSFKSKNNMCNLGHIKTGTRKLLLSLHWNHHIIPPFIFFYLIGPMEGAGLYWVSQAQTFHFNFSIQDTCCHPVVKAGITV